MIDPYISIIVPVYNVEAYIERCLASIRAQSFDAIEIICVNDCSPDGSWEIVKRHALEDSRMVLLEHAVNKSQGGARNTGIAAAKGQYLAGVDSDDYIKPNMLETLWRATDNGHYDVVCCGYTKVSEQGDEISNVHFPKAEYDFSTSICNIFNQVNPAFWNKLWRKNLFWDNQIVFPQIHRCEDTVLCAMILSCCKNLKIIDDALYNYVIRENSVTQSYSPSHLMDVFSSYEIIYNFMLEHKIFEKYEMQFLEHLRQNTQFEFNKLRKSSLSETEKTFLAKSFVMMKEGFSKMFKQIPRKDLEALQSLANGTAFSQKYE